MKPLMGRNKKGEHRALSTCEVLFHHSLCRGQLAGQTSNMYYAPWHTWHCARQLGPAGNARWVPALPGCSPGGKQDDRTQARKRVQWGAWALRGCRSGAHSIRDALSPEEELGGWRRSGAAGVFL